MELRILGSGTASPSPERNCSGYLLSSIGKRFLLDAGPGTHAQLSRYGIPFNTINEIFITHFHLDHVNDLPAILFSLKNSFPKETLKFPTIHGPQGFGDNLNTLLAAYGTQIVSEDMTLNIVEHSADEEDDIADFNIGLLNVKSLVMKHSEFSIGYRFNLYNESTAMPQPESIDQEESIQSEGDLDEDEFIPDNIKRKVVPVKSFTYSGDTAPCKNIIKLADGTDCLLIEATTTEENKLSGHSTIADSANVAMKAGVKTLILTHISPENDRVNIVKKASEIFNGIVIVAKDGMRISI